jgi:hypothetical protein
VPAAKILRAAGDNLFERLKGQSASRQILKHSVAVMASRLGIRFPCASLRPLLYPIVQSIVVERNIGGIESHTNYNDLRTASPEAEGYLLQKMQETLQKNLGAFRKDMRDLVLPFFEDTENSSELTYVKYHVFDKAGGAPIMDAHHQTLRACFTHPSPLVKGNLLPFVK